jgi:hypothetical protein
MRNTQSFGLTLAAIVAVASAACSGPSSQITPVNAGAPNARSAARGHSWMSPAAKTQSLIYVSSVLTNDVYVYSYATQQLVGTLSGFETPYGMCADKKGDVWIANDGASELLEYKHGGTSPIQTLSDANEYPEGCSIDPTTGNLAVTNFSSNSGSGNVAVYVGAQGSAQTYTDPSIVNYRFCGYDGSGNLFVDGANTSGSFAFAELPKGSASFNNITLGETVEWPGGVQWDGKHIDVGDTDADVIYQTNGAGGKIVGAIRLADVNYVNQYWIVGVKNAKSAKKAGLVVPSQDSNLVGIYKYPAGGTPVTTFSVEEPFGSVVSK